MRSDTIDLKGQTFGYLEVLEIASTIPTKWLCRCYCSNLHITTGQCLRNGTSTSCGCKTSELLSEAKKTHGLHDTPEHGVWAGMKQRCYNKNTDAYKNYGGRGITVCAEWKDDFAQFYTDMGKRPDDSYSIDRIDNDKGYTPENCRWVTRYEQNRNHRRNNWLTHNGETKCITDWAEEIGITQQAMQSRLSRMPLERALSLPGHPDTKRYITANGKTLTIDGWSKELGLCKTTIFRRLGKYDTDKALSIISRSGEEKHDNKRVRQSTKSGEFIKEFYSASEAGRVTGVSFGLISANCLGKQKTAGGYKWEYL